MDKSLALLRELYFAIDMELDPHPTGDDGDTSWRILLDEVLEHLKERGVEPQD